MENNRAPIGVAIEKNYDSEFCRSLPLHLVNLVQPHGVLLTLDSTSLHIVQVSENAPQYLGWAVEDLLEQPLANFLPPQQLNLIQRAIAGPDNQFTNPIHLTFKSQEKEKPLSALVHPKGAYVLVELEEHTAAGGSSDSFLSLNAQIKHITSLVKQANSVQEFAQITAEQMKTLSGYDRVLAYQFDPQWNGIVIGQAKEEDMDNYLGLRFPASDVPRQTRELFFKNPYRLIPTRMYKPVRLLPIVNPLTQQFIDLSDCNLRSVAAVHLEYMGNMGIMASLSMPLIYDNKLWGLISFHHKTPKNPGHELLSALELLTGIVSAQLAAKEKETAIVVSAKLKGIHMQLVEQLFTTPSIADGLLKGKTNLQHLLRLSGVALLFEGCIWTSGETPTNQEMKEMVFWLRRMSADALFSTDTLPRLYSRAKDYSQKASGLIVLALNQDQGEYILGFRPEVLQTIHWGGDPNQAIQMEADGKTYHPRHSFATYQETVKHTSLPWLPEELEAAEILRNTVLEKIQQDWY